MTIKYLKNGYALRVPPFTKAEENELYRQAALKGPVTILRGPVAPQNAAQPPSAGKSVRSSTKSSTTQRLP